MIFTEFAPNETIHDALLSLSVIFQPWRWKQGKELELIQKKINSYFPKTNTLFFLTGRATLFFLLSSLHLNNQDEIMVTGFTCEAVVLPVIQKGCKPIYVDIEQETLSMDFADLRKKITPQTKGIILQHTFGMIPKYRNEVLELAKGKNIFVIEDLAHGFNPKNSHLLTPSDKTALILSFGRSKAVSSVFGGGVVLSNKKIIQSIENKTKTQLTYPSFFYILRLLMYKPIAIIIKVSYSFGIGKLFHYISKYLRLLIAEITLKEKKSEYDIVFEKRFPNSLAILLDHQLSQFDSNQKNRIEISNLYKTQLQKTTISSSKNIPILRFPILVDNRELILNEFSKQNIFLGQWYNQPVAPFPLPLKKVEYIIGMCPVAENMCKHIINLPTTVTKKEAMLIIKRCAFLINK